MQAPVLGKRAQHRRDRDVQVPVELLLGSGRISTLKFVDENFRKLTKKTPVHFLYEPGWLCETAGDKLGKNFSRSHALCNLEGNREYEGSEDLSCGK